MESSINTEQQIIEAAKKIFIKKGFAGARLQDIADEAKINKAMLHYYFRSKEKLFDHIFNEALQTFFLPTIQSFYSDLPFPEKVEKFVSNYIDTVNKSPHLPLFMLHEIAQDPERLVKRVFSLQQKPLLQKFMEEVTKEVKAGRIRKVDPLQFFINMMSLVIFPFAAKPMIQIFMKIDDKEYQKVMEARKKQVVEMLFASIKK